MMIRAAVADNNKRRAEILKRRIVMFSLKSSDYGQDIEVDVAEYKQFDELAGAYSDLDIVFIAYELLRENMDRLGELYKKNISCIPVPVGLPEAEICDFLVLRPGGHLKTEDEQMMITKLCTKCAQDVAADDHVLQIVTRQGSYAVSAASILYCMSDQKYVSIVTKNSVTYRKLGKLDDLTETLPAYFLRVHQRFLINRRHFYGIDKSENNWSLILDTGERVPVSRVYQKCVDDEFKKLQYGCQK